MLNLKQKQKKEEFIDTENTYAEGRRWVKWVKGVQKYKRKDIK